MTIPRSAVTVAIALAVALTLAPFFPTPSSANVTKPITWSVLKAAHALARSYPHVGFGMAFPPDRAASVGLKGGLAVPLTQDGRWTLHLDRRSVFGRPDETSCELQCSLR